MMTPELSDHETAIQRHQEHAAKEITDSLRDAGHTVGRVGGEVWARIVCPDLLVRRFKVTVEEVST